MTRLRSFISPSRMDGVLASDAGKSRRLLRYLGFGYAAATRIGLCLTILPLAVVAAPDNARATTAAVGTLLLAWNLAQAASLLGRWSLSGIVPARWLTADVVVTCGVVLAQPWTVPATLIGDTGTGWVVVYAALIMVSWQMYLPVWPAVAACAATLGALVGAATTGPLGWTSAFGIELVWITSEWVMTRLLFRVLGRSAVRADRAVARAAAAWERSEVAAARRREERAYAAMLHDTAASTLLMVGLAAVDADAPWLRHQARRDLSMLGAAHAETPTTPTPMLAMLIGVVREYPALQVTLRGVPDVPVPPTVHEAVTGALREALANVQRHAGTTTVEVRGAAYGDRVALDINDAGRGFAPAQVPITRRGLSESVIGRMRRIGGAGSVTSAPGTGTRVRLEWPA